MVQIIVPIYKEIPSEDDLISLQQLFKILGSHLVTFVHPKNLDLKNYENFSVHFKSFDEHFFKNIYGYNQLMLSTDFYKSFSEKYLLIYQTDCFVFKDELLKWCEKDYDYIGAPWLRSSEKIPFFKLFLDRGISHLKAMINFNGNCLYQKDKSLIYNEVGNGGLSLRKRGKFIEILEKLPEAVKVYLDPKNQGQFYAEDVFFSVEPKRNGIDFLKPNYREAISFSIENKPEKAMKLLSENLPFGCHRWNKENRKFWLPFLSK